jgi:hypothetical protein
VSSPVELTTSESGEAPFRFFSPSGLWNESLAANAALDPSSAALMGAFEDEIAAGKQSGTPRVTIDTTAYSVPIYTVPAGEPTVRVLLASSTKQSALQSAWDAVPLPAGAQPSEGTDGELVVWQPSSDRMWEFWRLVHGAQGWSASWGGAIEHASSNAGVYTSAAWPGATQWWGASATSLALAGGLITLEDLQRGEINHALALSIPNVRASVYSSPAQRTDGKSWSALSLPEGAHLRLEPGLNLGALHLPRLTMMIAQAAQRYGIYVRDGSPNIGFYAQDPVPTGTNPYAGPKGYFEGMTPPQLLASFPWQHLQLLEMSLHNGD